MITTMALGLARAAAILLPARRRPQPRPQRRPPAAAAQPVLGPRAALRIRQAGEAAAMRVALGVQADVPNPHPPGTRQALLWHLSFQTRLMELETEAFAPTLAGLPPLVGGH